MRRRHDMPFGAQLTERGVRFRLWAPSATQVCLRLKDGGEHPMQPVGEGWYELTTDRAGPGSRYRFRIDAGLEVPDPASRYNPEDVHGQSEVVDPEAFDWQDGDWRGRPWHEAVVYELHLGSFTEEGSFAAAQAKLDQLAELGITAVELMPVADFPGRRNWGYDGVLPYAPDAAYGSPGDLKRFIQAAHARGLMVLLDVVYNHFGPEGNYLHTYARPFFTERHQTPWGAAINFDGAGSRAVRDFFIHNALYWLTEYHFDGLRLDAVHAIRDDSGKHILQELAEAVRAGPGREREVHLILENEANTARYLRWDIDAQWNDDLHHGFHVLLSGETDGYYADYADRPLWRLGRCLAEGFAYQGDHSEYHHGPRGEVSRDLPLTKFVNFLQNHDQIGNRAYGERLTELASPEAVKAALAVLLLAPSPPMLYMGEEWGSRRRFPFFCDFGPELAQAVTEGRRREFARFARFADPKVRETIPDPNARDTFHAAKLDWSEPERPERAAYLAYVRELLTLRRREIVPRLAGLGGDSGEFAVLADQGLSVRWVLGEGSRLTLTANLSDRALSLPLPDGRPLFVSPGVESDRLPPWSVAWQIQEDHGAAPTSASSSPPASLGDEVNDAGR